MSTIADAKIAHNYNCYNGYFFGCLQINFYIWILFSNIRINWFIINPQLLVMRS